MPKGNTSDLSSDVQAQYATDSNLRARSNLIARYSGRNWFAWVHGILNRSPGSSVVDVGCGMGWFWLDDDAATIPLERLVLVDSSPAMLLQARQNVSALGWIDKVAAVESDAVRLPFAEDIFDIALAMHMLYHVDDQEAAVRELARVLRPGGKAAISTNGLDNSIPLMALAKAAFGGSGRDPGAELFSPHMGYEILSRHFRHVEIHEFTDRLEITDPDDIFAALTSMPPGNTASDEQRDTLKTLLDKRAISSENPFIDNRRVYLLVATKE